MKKRILVDIKLECDPPMYVGRWTRDPERRAREYEGWIREFTEFLRDHRSQDIVNLSVERIYENQCSYCNSIWETDKDGCPVCCEKAVNEWEVAQKEKVSSPDALREAAQMALAAFDVLMDDTQSMFGYEVMVDDTAAALRKALAAPAASKEGEKP